MKLANNNTVKALSVDEVAIVLSFLPPTDILLARVCTTWKDAARKAIVPLSDFKVEDVRSYNLMRVMITALPNLQQLSIDRLGFGTKFSDGANPYIVMAVDTARYHTYDINVISNFRKLKELSVSSSPLNGSYPAFFNFPLLQSLEISKCFYLKWDLSMLSGCPNLRKFTCSNTYNARFQPTGDLSSLRILRNTLEVLKLRSGCTHIRGNIMDLADFPRLKELDLHGTSVPGDIRDIGSYDFPSIDTQLKLPRTVAGGDFHEFQRVSDVPKFMQAILPLLKREHIFNSCFRNSNWRLSKDSPDWYASLSDFYLCGAPFYIRFIRAGSRLGWRWENMFKVVDACEINWLDPEPSRESNDYDAFIAELHQVEGRSRLNYFRGYLQPPTEEEYIGFCNCNELLSDHIE